MGTTQADATQIGKVLKDEYVLQGPLGLGKCPVYRAKRRTDGQEVALRLLRSAPTSVARLLLERSQTAQSIRHPALASVLDCGTTGEDGVFVVSELVDGTTLTEWADTVGIPPLLTVVDFVQQLCSGLQAAYHLDLTHEALYPHNVLVTPSARGTEGRLSGKLLDISVPWACRGKSPPLDAAQFMAPEQLRDLHHGTPAAALHSTANVYSIGCLLYLLCTGGAPDPVRSVSDLLNAHTERPVIRPSRINPQVPAPLNELILRALARKPADRYSSVVELNEALAQIVATDGLAPRRRPQGSRKSTPPIPTGSFRAQSAEPRPRPDLDHGDDETGEGRHPSQTPHATSWQPAPSTSLAGDRDQTQPMEIPEDPVQPAGLPHAPGPPSNPPRPLTTPFPPPRPAQARPRTIPKSTLLRTLNPGRAAQLPVPEGGTASTPAGPRPPFSTGRPLPRPAMPPLPRWTNTRGAPAPPKRTGPPLPMPASFGAPPPPSPMPPGPRRAPLPPLPRAARPQAPGPVSGPEAPQPVIRPPVSSNEDLGLSATLPGTATMPMPAGVAAGAPSSGTLPRPADNLPSVRPQGPGPNVAPPPADPTLPSASDPLATPAKTDLERVVLAVAEEEDDQPILDHGVLSGEHLVGPLPYSGLHRRLIWARLQPVVLAFVSLGALASALALLVDDGLLPGWSQSEPVAIADLPPSGISASASSAPGAPAAGLSAQEAVVPPPSGVPGAPPARQPAGPPAKTEAGSEAQQPLETIGAVPAQQRLPSEAPAGPPRSSLTIPAPSSSAVNGPRRNSPTSKAATSSPMDVRRPEPPRPPILPASRKPSIRTIDDPLPTTQSERKLNADSGKLAASATITDLEVHGTLPTAVVRRILDRRRPDFEACYAKAASTAGRNAFGKVPVDFQLDYRGTVAAASARGGALPGLAACVQETTRTVTTEPPGPDSGAIRSSFSVSFSRPTAP